MKKKILLTSLLSLTLLASCGGNTTPSTSEPSLEPSTNPSTSEVQPSETPSTSEDSSMNEDSSTSESLPIVETLTSISKIREKAYSLKDQVNDNNVAYSETNCKIEGKLLGTYDAVTSKQNYGEQYKLLIANNEGYIYVKVDFDTYSFAKSKIGTSFEVKGKLSLYCDEPEIVLGGDLIEKEAPIDNVDTLFEQKNSILEVYDLIDNLTLNIKGCAFSSLVKFKAKLIAKMDDKVMLFYDGNNIIQGHNSDSKFFNGYTIGNTYEISGNIQMYHFKPSVECMKLNKVEMEVPAIDKTKLEVIDSSMYNVQSKNESTTKLTDYTDMFKELKLFKGYVNTYDKGGNAYVVLDTNFSETYYDTYQEAANKKALFLKNDSCIKLYSDYDFINCPFYDYMDDAYEIDVVCAPYLWNTSKYWQVYALEDTITLLTDPTK